MVHVYGFMQNILFFLALMNSYQLVLSISFDTHLHSQTNFTGNSTKIRDSKSFDQTLIFSIVQSFFFFFLSYFIRNIVGY